MNFQAFAEEMRNLADIDYFVNREFSDGLMRYNVSTQILLVWIDCKDYF